MKANTVTFAFGPAGTGKTFLAAYAAIVALDKRIYRKVVMCRPIVEALGENLGYLPGNLEEKCDPYVRPIFDAFEHFYTANEVKDLLRQGVLEISPLAYMRGRTFADTFIIADEMQNATQDQMLMLLTRIGENTKAVITGDPNQKDRAGGGYEAAIDKLRGCPNVSFFKFSVEDVVRSEFASEVVKRWGSYRS